MPNAVREARQRKIERLSRVMESVRPFDKDEFKRLLKEKLELEALESKDNRKEFVDKVKQKCGELPDDIKSAGQKAWGGVKTAANAVDRALSSDWMMNKMPVVWAGWQLSKLAANFVIDAAKPVVAQLPKAAEAVKGAVESSGNFLSNTAKSIKDYDYKGGWESVVKAGKGALEAVSRAKDYLSARAEIATEPLRESASSGLNSLAGMWKSFTAKMSTQRESSKTTEQRADEDIKMAPLGASRPSVALSSPPDSDDAVERQEHTL